MTIKFWLLIKNTLIVNIKSEKLFSSKILTMLSYTGQNFDLINKHATCDKVEAHEV